MMKVCLAMRAKRKKGFAIATGWTIALTLTSAFALIWGRILESAPLFTLSLILLVGLVCIQAVFEVLTAMKWISVYQPTDVESIVLSENLLFLGNKEILVSTLINLVIESAGYTGKWAGRSSYTGAGKLTLLHKIDKSEECYLITISSSSELKKLRILSEAWRNQGVAALVMD